LHENGDAKKSRDVTKPCKLPKLLWDFSRVAWNGIFILVAYRKMTDFSHFHLQIIRACFSYQSNIFPIIPFRQGGLRPVELGLLTMINIRPAEKLFWMTCFRLAVCGLTPGSAEGNCHESCEPIGPIGIAEISHMQVAKGNTHFP
jgi:hypothetical protein